MIQPNSATWPICKRCRIESICRSRQITFPTAPSRIRNLCKKFESIVSAPRSSSLCVPPVIVYPLGGRNVKVSASIALQSFGDHLPCEDIVVDQPTALPSSMAKGKSVLIRLLSNAGTGYYYVYRKNPKNPNKLQLMKHDPIVNKHVLFTEAKYKK